MCQHIEPFVKGHETGMRLFYRDQFFIDSAEELGLRPGLAKLPKQNTISHQHPQHDEEKTERQPRADVEPMEMRSLACRFFRFSGRLYDHTFTPLPCLDCADAISRKAAFQ